MTRRRALRLAGTAVAAVLVLALVAIVLLAQVFLRRPFPDYDAEVELAGLEGEVRVLRDDKGIPQIYADTSADLFRALGYVHAQDRFFEMDLRRHIAAGRLSELVGTDADALEADTLIRTMGWRRVAEQELSILSAESRSALDAYSTGVNDYLRERGSSALSVNYTLLELANELPRIEPWTPVDSVSWLKALAWDLKANYDAELARARAFATVRDVNRVDQLFPAYPFDRHEAILDRADTRASTRARASTGTAPMTSAGAAGAPAARAAAALPNDLRQPDAQRAFDSVASVLDVLSGLLGGMSGEIGSNSWVVSGRYTATGKPLLANDPHLKLSVPGVWFQVGLRCRRVATSCPYDVTGFSMAGLPGVFIGHNATIAWGLTSLNTDVTDFFLERVIGRTYLRDGVQAPIRTRQETIKVAGADPVTVTVRSTAHGPIVSDVLDSLQAAGRSAPVEEQRSSRGNGYAVALSWTALTPGRTFDALLQMGAAQDFDSFRDAGAHLAVPAQSLVYADVDGHIGYLAPGMTPIRGTASPGTAVPADTAVPVDGSWPLPGWDSSYDWRGFVPADELPWALDPDEGFFVTANQALAPPSSSGVHYTSDWDYGYRSQRIRDLVERVTESGGLLTVEDMESIQNDTRNLIAPDLVPILLQTNVDAFTRQAQDLLRTWQPGYEQAADSAAAAYFNAVWAQLLHLTFADELPDGSRPTGGSRWYEVVRVLLDRAEDPWWDDRTTPSVVETRDEIIRQALVEARLQLTTDLGKDPERWQWGRLHRIELRQTPLGGDGAPGIVHRLVNRGPLPAAGGTSAVNALAWDASTGTFVVTAGPTMRMVVDLADLDRSRWINLTGNSAHPSDDHYDDQLDTWLAGHSLPWAFSSEAVEDAAEHEMLLRPAGS